MNSWLEKFKSKNPTQFTQLNERMDELGYKLLALMLSAEMCAVLSECEEFKTSESGDFMSYRNKVVLKNLYLAANTIMFITDDIELIKFNLPCVCGFYDDEPHVNYF